MVWAPGYPVVVPLSHRKKEKVHGILSESFKLEFLESHFNIFRDTVIQYPM